MGYTDTQILDWLNSHIENEQPMFSLSVNPSCGKYALDLNSHSRSFYGNSLRECTTRAMDWFLNK